MNRTAALASLLLTIGLPLAGCDSIIGGGEITGGSDGGAGGDDDDEFGDSDAAICDQVAPVEITEVPPPDLLLVVDKSGSMAEPLGTGDQKWATMRNALNTVVTTYQDGIRFGLMLYPIDNVCGAGAVLSGIAPTNAAAISTVLNLTSPEGGTPTHTTMTAALQYYNGLPVNPQGRYVLLATDGQPNCANLDDPNIPTITESIAAIQAARGAGINTFVLGFGDGVNSDPATLQAMADAGGTGMFYAANSPAELQAALDAIAGSISVPDCTFALDTVPADPDRLGVYLDDAQVPRSPSHADGWDYDPATNSITLYGSTCDDLQSGAVSTVRVDYGCGGPVVL